MAPQNADEKLPGTHPFAKSKPILGSSFYRELSHQDLVTTFNQSDKAWSETFVVHPVDFLFFFDGWGSCVGYTQKNEFQVDPELLSFWGWCLFRGSVVKRSSHKLFHEGIGAV